MVFLGQVLWHYGASYYFGTSGAGGGPWDLEATPNFAAKIDEGSLPWPPKQVLDFPLKDW